MFNLTHTLDKMYVTGILYVQCLQISLNNDDIDMLYVLVDIRYFSMEMSASNHLKET